jgi:hypothetical protein
MWRRIWTAADQDARLAFAHVKILDEEASAAADAIAAIPGDVA